MFSGFELHSRWVPVMFSFFQVTNKKKLAENAETSHPRAIGSSFSQWTLFSYFPVLELLTSLV